MNSSLFALRTETKLLAILERSYSLATDKGIRHVTLVEEPGQLGDLRERMIRGCEQLTHGIEPKLAQVLVGGKAKSLLERSRELAG